MVENEVHVGETALHEITIDEGKSADSKDLGQPIFKAYCDGSSGCTWSGDRWFHPDEFFGYADPVAAARDAAYQEGRDHLISEGYDPL